MSAKTVLIVDDEKANLQKLRRTFRDEYRVIEATSGEEALRLLAEEPVAAIITDQRMPGMTGVDLLRRSLKASPESIRIILTGYTEVEDLMDAINEGHVDRYITKPWDPSSLRDTVGRELERWELKRQNEELSRQLKDANDQLARENRALRTEVEILQEGGTELIYESREMRDLVKMLDRVVQTDSTVLIQGETGTGKELLARLVHERSRRSGNAFVPVNCGAVPADLAESSFFGHTRGAFTGASDSHKGFFEIATGGTLFLDEIGEAPLELQVKFLRALQEGEVLPVGASEPVQVDVRVIASTNRNLAARVEQGEFRQDLFFRLNVFAVHVPPLRARRPDVPLLAEFFRERFAKKLNREVPGFEPATLELMLSYPWPGNVRELENEVERLVILSDQQRLVSPAMLSKRIRLHRQESLEQQGNLKQQLADLERRLILEALDNHRQNRSHAAAELGITRQTIISKLKQYESDNPSK